MATPWDLLISGQIIEGIIQSYTDTMGYWLYVFLVGLGLFLIYEKTQNIGTTGIVALLIAGVVMAVMPPQVQILANLLVIFALAAILWKAFKG